MPSQSPSLDRNDDTGEGDWIDRAAAVLRGMPRLRLADPAPDETDRLDIACEEAID